MTCVGVDRVLQFREAFAIRISCFGKKFLGFRNVRCIVSCHVSADSITSGHAEVGSCSCIRNTLGNQRIGGNTSTVKDLLIDIVTVYSQSKRLSHFDILQHIRAALFLLKLHIIKTNLSVSVIFGSLLNRCKLVNRHGVGKVKLTGLECSVYRIVIAHKLKRYLSKLCGVLIPIFTVFCHDYLIFMSKISKSVTAVENLSFHISRPSFRIRGDDVFAQRHQVRESKQVFNIRNVSCNVKLKGLVINRFSAEFFRRYNAINNIITVFEEITADIVVRRSICRIYQPSPGVNKILSFNRFSIAPEDVITESGCHCCRTISILFNLHIFCLSQLKRSIRFDPVKAFIHVRDVDHSINRFI